jgi:hypothetical protein
VDAHHVARSDAPRCSPFNCGRFGQQLP